MNNEENRATEFTKAYKAATGEKITEDEAQAIIERFVPLYNLLLRPLPGEESVKERIPRIETLHERLDISNTDG